MRTARRAALAFAAASMLAAFSARADCTFSHVQDIDVLSSHWNDVLFYNYETSATLVAGPAFGNRSAAYQAPKEQWLGAFLYDYSLSAYVEAQYSFIDLLYQID